MARVSRVEWKGLIQMIPFTEKVIINRPVEHVFPYVVNLDNQKQWMADVVASKQVSEGPIGVGTRYQQDMKMMGRSLDTMYEITGYEYPTKMSYEAVSRGMMEFGGQYTFTPEGEGTAINFNGYAKFTGAWRLVEPLFAGEVQRGFNKELSELKKVLEAER
jgi:hypothetical protein